MPYYNSQKVPSTFSLEEKVSEVLKTMIEINIFLAKSLSNKIKIKIQ